MAEPPAAVEHVRILGAVQAVTDSGEAIDLASASQRRLLALLALRAPDAARGEWLADVMDVSPGALRKLVTRLRAALGPHVVRTTSTGYRLDAEVDAHRCCGRLAEVADAADRLALLATALDAWAGPPLDEFRGEAWADGEAARLTEIHAAAGDDYGDELIARGCPVEAVAWLEARIAAAPLRDRTRGLLIRALAASGRQAEALRAFQDYRSFLADEVGTEPSPDLVEIDRQVASGWDGVEGDGTGPVAAAAPPGLFSVPLAGALAREVGFVGRAAELAQLAAGHDRARDAGLACVVVTGEPGIGKTSLLGEFARTVAVPAGSAVVYGRCDEAPVPLQPFRSVVGECVDAAPVELLRAHVAHCGGELLRLAPRLGLRVDAPAPTDTDHATERFLVFEAVTDLLRRLSARAPLVVVLDDLHWAESTALALVRHLARAGSSAPLLLVVSCRASDEHYREELRLALADLVRSGARRLALGGFDDRDLATLLRTARPVGPAAAEYAERAVELLRTETAGHPLYAVQLIEHWNDSGGDTHPSGAALSPTLRDVVVTRVAALGDAATEVLTAAAVLGAEFDEVVLADMVDLPDEAVVDALDVATRGGLLTTVAAAPRVLRFVHSLVANALYADIGASRRVRLHERAARALTKRHDEVRQSTVVALARHCALGGLLADAQHWTTVAGDHAFDHLAVVEAEHHYRSALRLAEARGRPAPERADLLVRLGAAQDRAGDVGSFATLLVGARLARESGERDVLIRAALATDRGFARYGSAAPEQLEIVEAAVAVADPDDRATYAHLLALLAQSLLYAGQADRRVALAREALAIAEQAPELLPRIASPVVNALAGPERAWLRAEIAHRAVAAAATSGDPMLEFNVAHVAYGVAVELADPDTADRSLARMRERAARTGIPRLTWMVGVLDTFQATMEARLEEAEALATTTFESGQDVLESDAFSIFASQVFAIGAFAGRHADLIPLVEQAMADNPNVLALRLAHAIVCAEAGRRAVAEDILAEAVTTGFAGIPADQMMTTSLIGYAVLALELGDVDAAARLVPLLEPYVAEVPFTGMTSQGPVAAYVGKLESLLGHHEVAEAHLREALEITDRFGWAYHRATTLFALAEARRRRLGALDPEGRAWLDEAAARCRAGGFAIWIRRIEALADSPPDGSRPTA